MSVIYATFSYLVRQYFDISIFRYPDISKFRHFDISKYRYIEISISPAPRIKRIAFYCGILLLIVFSALYLYVSGLVVSQNLKRAGLEDLEVGLSQSAQEAESRLAAHESALRLDFFTKIGYEEPRELYVIKRSRNVAENNQSRFLY